MNDRTISLLRQLRDADWFAHVGVNDTPEAVVLSTWEAAIAHSDEFEWENLRLNASNEFRLSVIRQSMDRYCQWNDIVREVKRHSSKLIAVKLEPFVSKHNLPESFANHVSWDLVGACIETEYSDICSPDFYGREMEWYIKGHFPCGWHGVYPEGMIIVY